MTHQVFKKLLCCVLAISHVGALAGEREEPPSTPPATAESAESTPSGREDRLFEVDVDVVSSEPSGNDRTEDAPKPAHQVDQYQVIVPTLHDSQDASNAGGMRFNFANRTVGSIRGVLEECVNRGFAPDFWKKEPPEIWIYFPSQEYFEENARVVANQILENFRAVYPGAEPTIRMAIANTPVNVEFLADELKASVDKLIEYAPGQAESLDELKDVIDQTKMEAIRLETEQQRADKVAWYKRKIRGGPHVSAVTSNRIRLYGAFVRAGSLGAIRAWQFMPAFAMGPARSAVALSAIAFDMGIEIYTAIFSQVIQTFFLKNPNLGFIQRQAWAPDWIKHPSVDSLVGLLTSGVWNTALFVGVRASVMQSAMAAAMPGTGLAYPTPASVWDSIKINSLGILTNWFWVKGYSLLKDKGWLSGATVNVFLQGLSSTDIGIGVANSSSNEDVRNVRNYLLPLQWAIYVGTFVAGLTLPINANRIIVVHNRVVDEAKAEAERERLAKNPQAANENKEFGVSDIPWLNLEQSGLRSLWTIPDQNHDAEIGRVVSLLDQRRERAAQKAKAGAGAKRGLSRFWSRNRGNTALAVEEDCNSVLGNAPTLEQIIDADGSDDKAG